MAIQIAGTTVIDNTRALTNITTGSFSGAVTVGGALTVTNGSIVLNGTGRIQGIDTVTAATDAASKSYVDSAVAAAGGGTAFSAF